jgi:hypothetical protein
VELDAAYWTESFEKKQSNLKKTEKMELPMNLIQWEVETEEEGINEIENEGHVCNFD